MRLKTAFVAITGLLLAPQLLAIDLLQSWQAAQQYDATMAAAGKARIAGQEKAVQGRALLLPQVQLQANAQQLRQESDPGMPTPGNPDGSQSGKSYGYSLALTQPIYRKEAWVSAYQLGKQTDLAELQYRAAEQQLILRVAKAYLEVLAAQEQVVLATAQRDAVAQQLSQAQKSFEVGVATVVDVNEAQARYDAILASEIVASNDLQVKKNAYALLTGLNPDELQPLGDHEQAQPPQPNDLNEWLARAANGSIELLAQQLNLDIAGKEIEKFRAVDTPQLDLVASYGNSYTGNGLSSNGGTDRQGRAAIGLQLAIPLYTGGAISSQLRESVAKKDQQSDQLEATRREVQQNTKQAFLGVSAGAAQIRALQQSLKSSKSSLDSTELGYKVGVSTIVDVLDANERYYNTRYQLVYAKYTYLYSGLLLAAATGQLNESDLEKANRWLLARQ
ncbi:TolC family outer membrane protein [Chitinilyticum litopenaei]|uniref:TolC family outer membrane protein n=1 Tax=Chitinilyticum litopenaei TaxID=1121276 RepID=UPI0003FB8F60|nr:TolC family outer membrane protein [Chitinilyticum litopenaei]